MLLIYKNKGLLVPVYTAVSVLGLFLIVGALIRNVGGVFLKLDMYTTAGIGFLIAALWTYQTKDDYYKDSEGNKVFVGIENSFFFISMKIWTYILVAIGLLLLSNLLFHYFPTANAGFKTS